MSIYNSSSSSAAHAASLECRQVQAKVRADAKAVKNTRESRAVIADALTAEPTALGSLMLWDLLGWCWRMTDPERFALLTGSKIVDPYMLVRELAPDQAVRMCRLLAEGVEGLVQ